MTVDRPIPDDDLDNYLAFLYPSEMDEDEETPWPEEDEITQIIDQFAALLPEALRKRGFDPP